MKTRSRSMVLTGPETLVMQSFDLPQIGEEDGLLAVERVGVCASDPSIYMGRQTRGKRPYPIILGHEIVGRIDKMGKKARLRLGVKEGDRVVLEFAFGCGRCDSCLAGRYTLCAENYTYGSMISCKEPPHLYGGYSEFVYIHPRAMVHPVGDDVPPEIGVLVCAVLGNGIRWLRHVGGVSIGDAVVIVGPGLQGISATAVAKESGADPVIVIGLSRDKARLEMARRFGADVTINCEETDPVEIVGNITKGKMADLVMDVSASVSGAQLALSLAGKGAAVVIPGFYKENVSLDLNFAVVNEIRLFGVFSHDFRAVRPAIKMVKKKQFPFQELISHCFPLKEAEKALKLVAGEQGEMPLKVLLDPNR
ncbi:MAG: alcohol dehydrogenase catalytic domain-containing protein [Deltaproteobacteria bacterium]|nr:alcohol dehydrogenase catalytic domain-containing protein [Deltaproteobacteria bacterium]MBW2152678.1 alcohol dehydrogenase catalytic domain-containing protein [Deltaproteobacteria bacterium]